jgi:hypothetical protein
MSATSLLYQFLVGGLFFTVGIAVPWFSGDYTVKKRADRRLLFSMLAAAMLYLVLQSAWHLYAAGSG